MLENPLSLLLDGVLSLLYPLRCEICGELQEPVVCGRCAAGFKRIVEPYCRQCGLPFDPLAHSDVHCADCREEPPPFDAARAAGIYGEGLRRAIHQYKYDGVRALAIPLADFITQTVSLPFPPDCLCPVPLHPARERMRGYNQSLLLAEELGRRWEIPVIPEMLARTVNTTPQMQLPADERRRNVRGAFTVTGDAQGRSVALVDDVFTTGSTIRECSHVLKRTGAARVLVITIARAVAEVR